MNTGLSKEQLQELVERLSWNDAFGCYTRAGFEKMVWPMIAERAKWLLFFDVDGVHELNERSGSYEVFDAMMKKVFSTLRGSDYVAGQLKSGDEFFVCLTENYHHNQLDPNGLQERMIVEMAKHGLSATFAVVPVVSPDLMTNVKPAVDMVYAAKKMRGSTR